MSWATTAFRRADAFIGLSFHEAIFPPPVPPVPYYPHFNFGFVTGATQLFSLPSSGGHREIKSNGLHLMGRGSDAFPIVPHFSVPPQWGLVMTTLFGSSNMVWGSSGVQMKCYTVFSTNGQNADISTALGGMVSPHLSCNEPLSFLLDIAVVTDSTTLVGMSLGDFMTCLVDIAVQLAMEIGAKAFFAGFKTLYGRLKSSSKVVKGDKFVKFSAAVDAVQAAKQADELADTPAAKALREAAADAEEAGIYKYGKKLEGHVEDADAQLAEVNRYRADIDQAFDRGQITEETWKKLSQDLDDQAMKAAYSKERALQKLEKIDDSLYETWNRDFWRQMAGTNKDRLVNSVDNAGTFNGWLNCSMEGTDSYFWKVLLSSDALAVYFSAWARTGDTWYQKMLYAFARRFWARVNQLISAFVSASMTRGYSSEEQRTIWGRRQELIDEVNAMTGLIGPGMSEEDATGLYDRFQWASAETGLLPTDTRFDWLSSAAPLHEQWADETFDIKTTDRFAWVPPEIDDGVEAAAEAVEGIV